MSIMRGTSIAFATAAVGLLAAFDTAQSDDGEVHYYLQQPASVSLASASVEADDDSDQDVPVRVRPPSQSDQRRLSGHPSDSPAPKTGACELRGDAPNDRM